MADVYKCKQCQDTGAIINSDGETVPCPVCAYCPECLYELDACVCGTSESQSSKHCDAGYMNDMRFGDY